MPKGEERRLRSHGELWEYVNRLVAETRDDGLGRLWRTAASMHVNFYEDWAPREEVERSLENIERFLRKLRELSNR
ncbi:MAG: PaREP1 family protein [Ignisphaera sp.]|nr:PaREP1 family protein [Ignisphaera sp.]MCC6055269.1 PaREP1 family protein [Desulfurococcaceae archaeon]